MKPQDHPQPFPRPPAALVGVLRPCHALARPHHCLASLAVSHGMYGGQGLWRWPPGGSPVRSQVHSARVTARQGPFTLLSPKAQPAWASPAGSGEGRGGGGGVLVAGCGCGDATGR